MKFVVILLLCGALIDPINCTSNCSSDCNLAGSVTDGCIDGQCKCKRDVEGKQCDRCAPSYFGLSADNAHGCRRCYCSYVANECIESSLRFKPIVVPLSALKEATIHLKNTGRPGDCHLQMNLDTSEMACYYDPTAPYFPESFWQLPKFVLGNRVKSYGGYLNVTQRFVTDNNQSVMEYHLVRLTGNGNTLYWFKRLEIVGNKLTYAVPLIESEWITSQNARATRENFMLVLSNLQKIEVRSRTDLNRKVYATYLSNISLDTAAGSSSIGPVATQIEVCRCPKGYEGTSCESCSDGYFRDVQNYRMNPHGTCMPLNNQTCPCNGHEKSCQMLENQEIFCDCTIEYTGKYCQHTVAVRTRPMHQKVPKGALISIACDVGYYNFENNGQWETITDDWHTNKKIQRRWSKYPNSTSSKVTFREGAMLIVELTEEDSGEYICKGFSETGREFLRAVAYVEIIPPTSPQSPKIIMIPSHQKGTIGLNPTISCLALGNAPITVTWSRINGRKLPSNVHADGPLLKFHEINEGNIDRYFCTATNHVGSITEMAQVAFVSRIINEPHTYEKKEFIIIVGSVSHINLLED